MKTLAKIALGAALAWSTQCAMANTMECGGTIIDDGQDVPVTSEQVLAACGQPTSRENGQWVYQEPGQFTKILRFDEDGNLQSIEEQLGNQ